MGTRPLLAGLAITIGIIACIGATPPEPRATRPAPKARAVHQVDFTKEIQPILAAHCQPCHFPGGKVYERMPFDRAETVVRLREKLFTRLKAEAEQKPIRAFLAEHPAPVTPDRTDRPSPPPPHG
jgi:hypothetical protein